jgi:hypothetical protein
MLTRGLRRGISLTTLTTLLLFFSPLLMENALAECAAAYFIRNLGFLVGAKTRGVFELNKFVRETVLTVTGTPLF